MKNNCAYKLLILLEIMSHSILSFIFKSLSNSNNKSIFIDIDNTIVDTRTFQNKNKNFDIFDKIDFPDAFPRAIEYFNNIPKHNINIYFISARPYNKYFLTNSWLKKHFKFKYHLIITRTLLYKYIYLNSFSECVQVEYYDDCTFGEILTNPKVDIDFVNKINSTCNIKYYGYDFIKTNFND